MCAVHFIIAFAFESNLMGGGYHIREVIVVTSDGTLSWLEWWSRRRENDVRSVVPPDNS